MGRPGLPASSAEPVRSTSRDSRRDDAIWTTTAPVPSSRCEGTAQEEATSHGLVRDSPGFGYVAAVAMTAAGAALGVLAVKSLPDVRRYLAMRKM
jgi:hypothetical protein